uniref:Xyloglucan endotransglucosylase/hydrolase n=1 Tax=Setaria italica TaxID=4555 RepID=K3XYV9_SETIT
MARMVIIWSTGGLVLDRSSGNKSCGFRSKSVYGSGLFHMTMKIPSGYTAGVVTTFYLISQPENGGHDEIDLEFLGDKAGRPVTLQTNLIIDGQSYREQRLHLWFDPAADFHDYKILWNAYQLVMFLDDTPVRVLRNLTATVPGYQFPSKPAMLIRGSVWDGSDWATDDGRAKVDWSKAPFTAAFRGFDVDAACAVRGGGGVTPCNDSAALWWNGGEYEVLSGAQRAAYEGVKKNNMVYDYCTDKLRFNNHVPLECSYN